MGIRAKLLWILLAVALPPLVIIALLNGVAVRQTAKNLAEEQLATGRSNLVDTLEAQLQGQAVNLDIRAQDLETLLRLWASEIQEIPENQQPAPAHPAQPGHGVRLAASLKDGQRIGDWRAGDEKLADLPVGERVQWVDRSDEMVAVVGIGGEGQAMGIALLAFNRENLVSGLAVPTTLRGRVTAHVLPIADPSEQALSDLPWDESGHRWVEEEPGSVLLVHHKAGPFPAGIAVRLSDPVIARQAVSTERQAEILFARLQIIGLVALAVFALIAILLAVVGARFFTRPVQILTDAVRQVAAGDLETKVNIQTGDQFQELGDRFNQMVPQLGERLRMHKAMELAVEVQQQLLPQESPRLAGFDIRGMSVYHDATGGDYFDFLDITELDRRHLGVAVGDVTGHGVAAALIMATARALLRGQSDRAGGLSELMNGVNRHLAGDTSAGRFMTLFYGILGENSSRLRWVNAGHNPGIHYDPDEDRFEDIGGEDIPLGIDQNWNYLEHERDLMTEGSVLVLATDGIIEARNQAGEMLGAERLRTVIRAHCQADAETLSSHLARAVTEFRDGRRLEDDATLVVIKRIRSDRPA